jgi:hypothetical protein
MEIEQEDEPCIYAKGEKFKSYPQTYGEERMSEQ